MSQSLLQPVQNLVKGACPHDCPDTCSLLTQVKDGRAVAVHGNPEHPQTAGVLCNKVSRYTERSYHPQRLLHPLQRVGPKGSGQFEPISWKKALTAIATRLQSIAERQPEAIVPYSYGGTLGAVQGEGMAARFFNRLGAAQLDRSICASAGAQALMYTYGNKTGMRVEQFAQSGLILIWGSNPVVSSLHFWRYAQEAKRHGAKLICIDPRRSETTEKCHEHLALLPGTDAALALTLMHELIVHDRLDHDYISEHTLGFDALKTRALEWSPERAAKVCGLQAEQIRALAQDYANIQPAAIRLNYGMQRTRGGGNAVRAVACLPALIGAWRHSAGGFLLSSSDSVVFDKAALHRPDLMPKRQPRTVNMSTIGQALSPEQAPSERIEALIVYNSNPVAVAPDSTAVVRGFSRDDLFTVVLEHFQTDTADYADFILPATTQLEHWDIHKSYGHTDIVLNRPAIAPLGQSKPNSEVFRLLAKSMGFTDSCFTEDDQTLCRQALGLYPNADGLWETLLDQGFCPTPQVQAPYAQGGFATASGKCEFVSTELSAQGLDGLPDYLPNYESFGSSTNYPLAMISPPARHFLNSSFANVESLAKHIGDPFIEIHPNDALIRQINSGDTVRIFNDRGDYHCFAQISTRARPGLIVGLGIWWRKMGMHGNNVNQLTSQKLADLGNAATFYDCLVEVERATASP